MADAGSLAVKLKVNSEGLIEGLKVAGKTVDGVAQSFRTSFGTVGQRFVQLGPLVDYLCAALDLEF